MFTKRNIGLLVILISSIINSFSQCNIRSITNFESSTVTYNMEKYNYLDNINFEQSLFWRRRYNSDGQNHDSYFTNSIYFKDSVVGIKYFGFDMNFMHEKFDNLRMNEFRMWNCIRLGFALSTEINPFEEEVNPNQVYNYLNGNIYVKYYHIRKSARGDKTTKHRRGTWGFYLNYDYFGRIDADLHIKPFSYLWVHTRYRKDLNNSYVGMIFGYELNPYGFENCLGESTRDTYNGVLVFAGPEYNLTTKSLSLNIGIKLDFRNH